MPPLDNLSDAPLISERAQTLIDEIDTLLDDERYRFAADTLEGIKATLSEGREPTPGQYLAVRNIRESKEKSVQERGGWSRRYEGR